MNRISTLLVFLLISFISYSQEDVTINKEQRAKLYLLGGSELEVSIIDWNPEVGIKFITIWGQEMFFPSDKILKIKSLTKETLGSHYIFKEKGIYYSMSAGLITANNGVRNSETYGYSLSFSSGYRLSRLLSIGLGSSVDQYAHGSGERMHPIFLDFRSYLLPNNSTFVLNLQTGYSLAFKNENKGITDAKGGFIFYPSLGMSFGSSITKYSIDLGYKFQKATWTYANPWDSRISTENRINYQRFVLRFGIVL